MLLDTILEPFGLNLGGLGAYFGGPEDRQSTKSDPETPTEHPGAKKVYF